MSAVAATATAPVAFGPVRVAPAAVRASAPAVAAVATAVDDAVRRLTALLAGEGACWGDDEAGHTFAATYLPAAQRVTDAFAVLSRAVTALGDQLLQVADNLDGAEDRAAARLS